MATKKKSKAPATKAKAKTKPKAKKKGTPRPTCIGNKFAVGNNGGRPREWTDADIAIENEALKDWIKNPKNYFLTSFLIDRDLHKEQMERFARYNQEFCATFEKAKQVQEQRLVDLAVTKKGDGGFIKFVLQNKAGWKEKSEISGDAANPLAVILERIGQTAKDPLDELFED